MRQKLSPKLYLKNKLKTLIFFFSLVLTLFAVYFFSRQFSVSKIEIISTDKLPNLEGIENFYGQNLLLINTSELKQNILVRNPFISTVHVTKKYPASLILQVTKTSPQAKLITNQGHFILDGKGKIILRSKQDISNLPKLNYYQKLDFSSFSVGEYINLKDITTSLHFLKKVEELGFSAVSIDISSPDMIRLHLTDGHLIFTSQKSVEIQNYQLEKLIYQLKIEGKKFIFIDLRFDKPVVKLK